MGSLKVCCCSPTPEKIKAMPNVWQLQKLTRSVREAPTHGSLFLCHPLLFLLTSWVFSLKLLISSLRGVDGAGPIYAGADSVNEALLSACAAGRGQHQVQSGRALSFLSNLVCFKMDSTRKMSFQDG